MKNLRHFLSRYYYGLREEAPVIKSAWQRGLARVEAAALKKFALPEISLSDLNLSEDIDLGEPILENICMPPHQKIDVTHNDHDDFSPLIAFAKVRQPRIILELGTAQGNTVANLCRVCPEAHVYTVNAPLGIQTGDITTFQLDAQAIGRVYRNHGYEARVVQIYENTLHLDLARHLDNQRIDLAIIDACHDAAYVINDFEKVKPFMNDYGVVFLHDTHPSMKRHLYGSYLGCVKLRRSGCDIRHLSGTWWGVWTNWP